MGVNVRNRLIVLVLALLVGVVFLVPTFSPEKFQDRGSWISRPLSLGLDLSGGVHLVYEVQADEAVKSRLQTRALAIKSELAKGSPPIAILRAVATTEGTLEFTPVSRERLEAARNRIEEKHRDLLFVRQVTDGAHEKLVYSISDLNIDRIKSEAISQAIETLRNRIDQFGVAEPIVQQVGLDRIMLQMPGIQDIDAVKRVVGSVAKLEFRLVPRGGDRAPGQVTLKFRSGEPIQVEDEALMTGDAVDTARATIESGPVEVNLSLTAEGSREFARITRENVGRQLAIILDGVVYSAPNIQEPITGGHARITGGFKYEEARQLAIVLKAGALPAPLKAIEERTVGPTLGQESIEKGFLATLIGFAAIVVFMLVYYRGAGAIAVTTLFVNGFLLMACLSAFGATLTLPGIAGLGLTLGMAVDSNVIIFERIRDELRNGSGRDAAVLAGFNRAFSAILDSNLTTLLSAIILFILGSGPIRGFAVTLAVGIVTTVFCAVFVARLLFDLFPLRSGRHGLSI